MTEGTGRGKPGYCKVCDHAAGPFLNEKVKKLGTKFNATKAQDFALELGLTFNRETWYSHVKHITHPLITLAKQAEQSPVIVPTTNQGALEMIRNIGMKRAVEHPDEVTIDHALKAATTLETRKLGTDNIQIIIAKFMAAEKPAELETEVIVGEWRSLPDTSQLHTEEGTL